MKCNLSTMNNVKKTYGQALVTAVIIILVSIAAPILNKYSSQPKESLTSRKSYAIESISPEFELIWQKGSFSMPLPEHNSSILMVADTEQAYVLSEDGSIVTLNLQNGEADQLVRMPYKVIPVPLALTIGMNSDTIYIGFDSTQKIQGNMSWGAGKIEARDRASGLLKWSRIIPGAAYVNLMIVTEDTVNIDGFSSNNYYLLNAATGEILQSEPKLDSSFIWRSEDDLAYERTIESSFQLRNQEEGKILWQSEYFGVAQPPIFTDSRIVFKSGAQVFAIDKANGQIVWEYAKNENNQPLYSNITSTNDTTFFMTEKGALLAVDNESGEILGGIQFSPPPFNDTYNDTFQIASGNEIVLVHTGSTKQLFAFHFYQNRN